MCKTIKIKAHFKAPPPVIYDLLTDARKLRAVTGKAATIDQTPGGRFSNYAGSVTGINVDLLRGKRIVQAWRDREFPVGIFSMATFNLATSRSGGTELVLTHRGVPKKLIPRIERDWRRLYWEKIKAYLETA
jgi:activator of HSP90 ATPase